MNYLNYYIVEFYVPPPYCNHGEDLAAVEALHAAEQAAEKALQSVGVSFIHEYMWTDGSLFKRIKTTQQAHEVITQVNSALATMDGFAGWRIVSILPLTRQDFGGRERRPAYQEFHREIDPVLFANAIEQ